MPPPSSECAVRYAGDLGNAGEARDRPYGDMRVGAKRSNQNPQTGEILGLDIERSTLIAGFHLPVFSCPLGGADTGFDPIDTKRLDHSFIELQKYAP